MICLIDNYDSFTYNVKSLLQSIFPDKEIFVFRNDVDVLQLEQMNPSLLFIGPGPGNPKTAGNCLSFIKAFHSKIPIFGLCLGMQAINEYFGGTTYPLQKPVHGLASSLHITNAEYSKWQNSKVARYHSLACKLADNIELLAEIENIPMMIRQKESKMAGVQFHPESFLSENGKELLTQLIGDIYE